MTKHPGRYADALMKPSKTVSDYMAKIGAEGGKKGGTAKGKRKARSPEHYAKMVAARKAKRNRSNQNGRNQ